MDAAKKANIHVRGYAVFMKILCSIHLVIVIISKILCQHVVSTLN